MISPRSGTPRCLRTSDPARRRRPNQIDERPRPRTLTISMTNITSPQPARSLRQLILFSLDAHARSVIVPRATAGFALRRLTDVASTLRCVASCTAREAVRFRRNSWKTDDRHLRFSYEAAHSIVSCSARSNWLTTYTMMEATISRPTSASSRIGRAVSFFSEMAWSRTFSVSVLRACWKTSRGRFEEWSGVMLNRS